MAAEATKPKVTLPKEYSEFSTVFFKEAINHFLLSCSYNHGINLDEFFIPNIGKIYPLSPDKRKATRKFLDENLKAEKICPLNFPQASPFFFIKKKDGGLQPCQDYCYLNEHTV